MIEIIAILTVMFFAVFVQASTAFGIALVAMPLLTTLIGLAIAAPLVSITALTCQLFMIYRYQGHFSFSEMRSLISGAAIGIGIGSLVVGRIPTGHLVEMLLGVLVTAYALYALAQPNLPPLKSAAWGYGLGVVAGFLSRIYNVGGPPVVIYADRQGWEAPAFKGNLQIYGIFSTGLVIVTRAFNAEFTPMVIQYYLLAIPVILLGLFVGFSLERRINSVLFRKLVLIFLVVVGVTLVL